MWKQEEHALTKTFEFNDFVSAFSWMTKVAMWAEKLNHHPTWSNTYNKVSVKLTTHDAGNKVTEKDQLLAQKMDELYNDQA